MPDPADTRLVLNSYLFYEEIAQAILAQAAEPTPGSSAFDREPGAIGVGLYQAIVRNRHKIVITDRIAAEYLKEAADYQGIPLTQIIDALRVSGVGINPSRAGQPNLRNVPKWHRPLVEDAIRTRSRYLITRREAWHRRAQYLESHALSVVYPEEYVG